MTTVASIEQDFRRRVCDTLRLEKEGPFRYRVFTPFVLEDGDEIFAVLKKGPAGWIISDEGNTFMRLSYDFEPSELQAGTRGEIIETALTEFGVENRDGVLIRAVDNEGYGEALYGLVQAILKIMDVVFLSRERVISTFEQDFKEYFAERVPQARRNFDWHHPEKDPDGKYPVDLYINNMAKPLFVFALKNDSDVKDADITIRQFESWQVPHFAVGVFEKQEDISRRVLARFSDVCDKQFSNLTGNRTRIAAFLSEHSV